MVFLLVLNHNDQQVYLFVVAFTYYMKNGDGNSNQQLFSLRIFPQYEVLGDLESMAQGQVG